ncbi:very long chain fatty acid elongase AAEL008004-like [Dermacentor albipictus]|uniref:very long chain fatty acid elongase AAEL008004-like n=1 Tax=Dermacentor albipictus TaxID=60249 RepID=UPI0031FD1B47
MDPASVTAAARGGWFRRDPRTASWFLVGNVPFLLFLLLGYVYVVKIGGPRFMKGRKPYESIKPVIVIYNATMVLLNCYFVVAFLSKTYLGGGYSFICQGIDFEARDDETMSLLTHCWMYFWIRVVDFLDTVFFVLRKKESHVSFLHLAHHVLVVSIGWYGLAYGADGHAAFTVIFNSFVHVIMYTYYLLSLLGPSVRPYLWWKRYLTQLQMFQFVVLMLHGTIPLFVDCGYPTAHIYIGLPQGLFFLVMFVRFYASAYSNKKALTTLNGVIKKIN